jgi:deferrochelatase/peroxidase EfeB
MPNPQHAILTNLTKYQWYTHFSRTEGADLGVIKPALRDLRAAGAQVGVTTPVNVCVLFVPSLLAEVTDDIPNDFQDYPGYESPDGKVAKATQEELLVWIHSDDKDLCWEAQYNFRTAVDGHMNVARETPTFIYRCREQAPMRERMEAIYGHNGHERDALTDYSTPASGSFYFAPSVETLDAALS